MRRVALFCVLVLPLAACGTAEEQMAYCARGGFWGCGRVLGPPAYAMGQPSPATDAAMIQAGAAMVTPAPQPQPMTCIMQPVAGGQMMTCR